MPACARAAARHPASGRKIFVDLTDLTEPTMTKAPDRLTPPFDGGLWLSITELAKRENVTKQTIAEKVARLEFEGLIETRKGKRNAKLVNVAQYLAAVGRAGDAAKELAAADRSDEPLASPAYQDARLRDLLLVCDLKELELNRQLAAVVPVGDMSALATEIYQLLAAEIDRLEEYIPEMTAAVARDGVAGARALLKRMGRELRQRMADAIGNLGKVDAGYDPQR